MPRHDRNTPKLSKGQKRRLRVMASRAAQAAKPKPGRRWVQS